MSPSTERRPAPPPEDAYTWLVGMALCGTAGSYSDPSRLAERAAEIAEAAVARLEEGWYGVIPFRPAPQAEETRPATRSRA